MSRKAIKPPINTLSSCSAYLEDLEDLKASTISAGAFKYGATENESNLRITTERTVVLSSEGLRNRPLNLINDDLDRDHPWADGHNFRVEYLRGNRSVIETRYVTYGNGPGDAPRGTQRARITQYATEVPIPGPNVGPNDGRFLCTIPDPSCGAFG